MGNDGRAGNTALEISRNIGEEVVDGAKVPFAVGKYAAQSVVLVPFNVAAEGDGVLTENIRRIVVDLIGVVVEGIGADGADAALNGGWPVMISWPTLRPV